VLSRSVVNLVWGRKSGHEYKDSRCASITGHITEPVLVVRGHCVAGTAGREGRGTTIGDKARFAHASGDFVASNDPTSSAGPSGVTFGCLRYNDEGVVSGIARVDCGASASIRLNEHMSVLEIQKAAAFRFKEHRFSADGRGRPERGSPPLYTP